MMHAIHQTIHAFFNPHSFTLAIPDVWAGFQVNLRMMFVAEALVLVLALTVALIRGLPGPAAKPLRALAIAPETVTGRPDWSITRMPATRLPGVRPLQPSSSAA